MMFDNFKEPELRNSNEDNYMKFEKCEEAKSRNANEDNYLIAFDKFEEPESKIKETLFKLHLDKVKRSISTQM